MMIPTRGVFGFFRCVWRKLSYKQIFFSWKVYKNEVISEFQIHNFLQRVLRKIFGKAKKNLIWQLQIFFVWNKFIFFFSWAKHKYKFTLILLVHYIIFILFVTVHRGRKLQVEFISPIVFKSKLEWLFSKNWGPGGISFFEKDKNFKKNVFNLGTTKNIFFVIETELGVNKSMLNICCWGNKVRI